MEKGNAWILAARPKTLPAAATPVLLGSALAWNGGYFDLTPALLALTFALLVQVGTNYANDYFDFVKGADTGDRKGPPRAVAAGLVKPESMRSAMFVVLGTAFLSGCGLISYGGWWLLFIGVVSIISGILYTGGPFPLAYNGLGEVFVFLFFGLVAVMFTFFVQAGDWEGQALNAFVIGVGAGSLSCNLLVVNNYRDREEDRRARKRTLAVWLGDGFTKGEFFFFLLLAFLVPWILWIRGFAVPVLLPLVLLPLAVALFRDLQRARDRRDFGRLLEGSARLLVLYGFLGSLGIAFG